MKFLARRYRDLRVPPQFAALERAGGFKIMIEDRLGDHDLKTLQNLADNIVTRANQLRDDPR